jgi:rare lipoprotein A
MKRITILLFTLYFSAVCIQQHTVAQPVPVPGGEYFRQEGVASWYGYEFDGRPTASGEIYNSSLLTAAHPTLPFGTILLVTNRQNNRQVAVKVNDRGPFVASRIIDLSRAAAEQLDMLITGTAPVTIDKIQTNHPLYASPSAYLPSQAFQPPPAYLPPQAFQQSPGYVPIPPQAPLVITQPMLPQPQRLPPLPQQPVQTPILVPTPPPVPLETSPPTAAPYAPITVTVYPPQTQPAITPSPMDLPGGPKARLSPSITPLPDKTYKLQVGSYKVAGNAVDAYVKLKAVGLEPSYERKDDYFRVVLAGIRGVDVTSVTGKLGTAGFREAIIREDR